MPDTGIYLSAVKCQCTVITVDAHWVGNIGAGGISRLRQYIHAGGITFHGVELEALNTAPATAGGRH